MSGLDKVLISDMMESFVTEAPPIPFVSYCVVCHVFLTKEEMVYEKGQVFHRQCFEEHGKEFPNVNRELTSQNTNAKLQLIQLKNLKARQIGVLSTSNAPKNKTKKIVKKTKKKTSKKKRKVRSSKGRKKKRSSTKKRGSRKRRITRRKKSKSRKKSRRKLTKKKSRRRARRR